MTEYEFEYEFLQDVYYKEMIAEFANTSKLSIRDGAFEREFKMDEETFDHIVDLSESGAIIDFEIPEDAPMGTRLSEMLGGVSTSSEEEFVPVDMSQEFGGEE